MRSKVCNLKERKVFCSSCPCVEESECQHILNLRLKQQEKDVKKTLESLICNRKEKKFFCCTSEPDPAAHTYDYSFLPFAEKRECGLPMKTDVTERRKRSVGGDKTSPGKYPYTALLGSMFVINTEGKKTVETRYVCGGVLINKWYVVTAAHCHTENSLTSRVRLGEWEVGNRMELPPVQDFVIEPHMVHTHEEYKNELPYTNDIALIKLPRPAVLNEGVQMACLPLDPIFAAQSIGVNDLRDGLVNQYATFVGWGFIKTPLPSWLFTSEQGDILEHQVPEKTQQKLNLPILNASECRFKSFTPASSQICAGGEEAKGTCQGDAGGPLYIKHLTQDGKPSPDDHDPVFLIGIVNFGSTLCGAGTPEIFTRITDMIPWIVKNLV